MIEYDDSLMCPCGEMDITPVFGTGIPGSNPGKGDVI